MKVVKNGTHPIELGPKSSLPLEVGDKVDNWVCPKSGMYLFGGRDADGAPVFIYLGESTEPDKSDG